MSSLLRVRRTSMTMKRDFRPNLFFLRFYDSVIFSLLMTLASVICDVAVVASRMIRLSSCHDSQMVCVRARIHSHAMLPMPRPTFPLSFRLNEVKTSAVAATAISVNQVPSWTRFNENSIWLLFDCYASVYRVSVQCDYMSYVCMWGAWGTRE